MSPFDSKRVSDFINTHCGYFSQSGRSWIVDCPVCGGKKKLYIDKTRHTAMCFKQGDTECPSPSKGLPYALSRITNMSVADVRVQLSDIWNHEEAEIKPLFGDDQDTFEGVDVAALKEAVTLPGDVLSIGDELSTGGARYLEGRGIGLQIAEKYGIMFSRTMSPFLGNYEKSMVIFPSYHQEHLTGWQGRSIDPKVNKRFRMFSMPGLWRLHSLMFYNFCYLSDFIIIAEGAVSALKFYKVGNFAATMGKTVSPSQIDLILKNPNLKDIYIAFDRDAVQEIRDLYKKTALDNRFQNKNLWVIEVPEHRGDFGDCTPEECVEAFKNAQHPEDFLNRGAIASIGKR